MGPAVPVSSLAARVLGLSPPLTRDIRLRRDIAVRVRDGVILRTDHYAPRLDDAPTVLIRTPYGRGGVTAIAARLLAERGFHVVMQSCRGTGGSGGAFDPMRHERDDGLDTVDWLRRQPWFNGRLGTFGPSYVGYTQWAIADVPELAAMATVVTASSFRDPVYAGNSFALFTTLAWATVLRAQTEPWLAGTVEAFRGQPRLRRAFTHLPLVEADERATGAEVSFFRRWLDLAGDDPVAREAYWGELSHAHRLPGVTAPMLMIGGWYDIFLPWQLHDYATLRAAGANPYLTIGPWTHGGGGLLAESVRESVDWLRTHLRGEPDLLRERPVRLYVVGAESSRPELARIRVVAAPGRRPTVAPTPGRAAGSGAATIIHCGQVPVRSGRPDADRRRATAAGKLRRSAGQPRHRGTSQTCSSTPATRWHRTWRSLDRSRRPSAFGARSRTTTCSSGSATSIHPGAR